MDTIHPSNEEKKVTRHYGIVMAFAFVCLSTIACYFVFVHWHSVVTYISPEEPVQTIVTSEFGRYAPVELYIPALDIRTGFVEPLGLEADQTIMVPDSYTEVGWYKNGATPGEIGTAVILGHVDSKDGPAIFYSLGQLNKGDEIRVSREDGSTATFIVTGLQRYPQAIFPTLDVYGPTDTPTLRLVTCSGTFDKDEQRYSHNLVVYAEIQK